MGRILSDEELKWEVVTEEHIIQDEWMDFRKVKYRFPDGSEFEPFYQYSRRSYVVIVATDEEGKFICVRQYRHGIGRVTVEFPAGGIERKDGKEYGDVQDAGEREDALEAAKRELMEESGYTSEDWTHLITVPGNATIADNYAFVYYARNCKRVAGLHLDETEFLEPELHTREEIQELIDSGRFAQAVHIMALLLAEQKSK